MEHRNYTKNDYSMVCSWWTSHGAPCLPEQLLPPTGFVVEDGIPLCAGWLYKTDGGLALLENFIGNPEAPKEKRMSAVNLLMDLIIEDATKNKFLALMTTTQNARLIEHGTKNLKFKEVPGLKVFVRGL